MAKWLDIVSPKHVMIEVAKNALMTVPVVSRWRVRLGRTSSATPDVTRHALAPFAALSNVTIEGCSILEIGPGDHAPVGMLALGVGAASYSALDRFPGDVAGAAARSFYARVADAAPEEIKLGWKRRGVDPAKYPGPDVVFHTGALEDAVGTLPQFDVIFSYAVVEHLRDPGQAFATMRQLLKPNGAMVHVVDYGPHHHWIPDDNPLAFLAIPAVLWHAMGSQRGLPNRVRHPEMMDHAKRAHLDVTAKVTQTFSQEAVRRIAPFIDTSADGFAAKEAVLVCRHPRVPD